MHLDKDGKPVGYGRPPAHTQYKPKESGNPKGRPKGSKNVSTRLKEAASEKIVVKRNGKTTKMSKLDAGIEHLVNRHAQGDFRATVEVMNRLTDDEIRAEQRAEPVEAFSEADRATLEEMRRRMLDAAPKEEPDV